MMKKICSILLLAISQQLFSQITLDPGPVLQHEKGYHLYKLIGKTDTDIFAIWVDQRGKGGNDEFYLEKYDLKTLAPKFSLPVSFSDEKGKYNVLDAAYLVKDRIVCLTTKHREHQKALYAQVFDLEGKTIRPVSELEMIEVKTPNNSHFKSYYNKDENVIVITKDAQEGKMGKHSVSVYKADDLKKQLDLDFRDSEFRVNDDDYYDFHRESNGQVHYLACERDYYNEKEYKANFSLVISTPGKPGDVKIPFPDEGEQIMGALHFYLPEKNCYIIGGILVKKGKWNAYLVTVDAGKNAIVSRKFQEIEVSDEKRFVWKIQKGTEKIKFSLNYRNMLCSGNTVWIVAEQNAAHSNGDAGVFFYNYDLIAAHFDLETGKQGWNNFNKREKLLTRTESGGSTCAVYMKDQDLNVVYLESLENLAAYQKGNVVADDLEKVVEHNNSTLVVGKVGTDDKVSRQTSSSEYASAFHLKCRIVPNASEPQRHNFLMQRLSDDSLLIYLEDKNEGRWAIAKNVK